MPLELKTLPYSSSKYELYKILKKFHWTIVWHIFILKFLFLFLILTNLTQKCSLILTIILHHDFPLQKCSYEITLFNCRPSGLHLPCQESNRPFVNLKSLIFNLFNTEYWFLDTLCWKTGKIKNRVKLNYLLFRIAFIYYKIYLK